MPCIALRSSYHESVEIVLGWKVVTRLVGSGRTRLIVTDNGMMLESHPMDSFGPTQLSSNIIVTVTSRVTVQQGSRYGARVLFDIKIYRSISSVGFTL